MKVLLTFCLFFISISFFAQGTYPYSTGDANVVDARGFRQGYWKITAGLLRLGAPWHPSQIVSEGNYTDSKPEGMWVHYNSSGSQVATVSWKNGRRDGVTKYFRENGTLSSSCEYLQNKRNGKMTWHYPDGQLLMETTWNNGEMIGTAKTYYASGKLFEEGTWANGWWTSRKVYNENGTLK